LITCIESDIFIKTITIYNYALKTKLLDIYIYVCVCVWARAPCILSTLLKVFGSVASCGSNGIYGHVDGISIST